MLAYRTQILEVTLNSIAADATGCIKWAHVKHVSPATVVKSDGRTRQTLSRDAVRFDSSLAKMSCKHLPDETAVQGGYQGQGDTLRTHTCLGLERVARLQVIRSVSVALTNSTVLRLTDDRTPSTCIAFALNCLSQPQGCGPTVILVIASQESLECYIERPCSVRMARF